MHQTLLHSAAWLEYDQIKVLKNQDKDIFCPDEPWELNCLIETIRNYYPSYTDIAVSLAIRQAVKSTFPPRTRTAFVSCVLKCLLEKKPLMIG